METKKMKKEKTITIKKLAKILKESRRIADYETEGEDKHEYNWWDVGWDACLDSIEDNLNLENTCPDENDIFYQRKKKKLKAHKLDDAYDSDIAECGRNLKEKGGQGVYYWEDVTCKNCLKINETNEEKKEND